jgi:hypothetical protein
MGRYEGPGIASGVACMSKFLQHRDIATSQPVLKWFNQNVCNPGDQGIILKGLRSSTRLSLRISKITLNMAGE